MVQDGHLASRVIHGVVAALRQLHTTSSHHHRTLRHIIGTQRDDIGRRALILTHQHEFVLLGYLLGNSLCRVIQFRKGIFISDGSADAVGLQVSLQTTAERLHGRQEHTAIGNGIALNVVEVAVGVCMVVIVQAVGSQQFDDSHILHLRLRNIGKIDAGSVTLVLDVKAELCLFYCRGEIIDVFHHQVPVTLRGVVARILQRLDKQRITGIGVVGSKLAHPIGHATRGVFVGNSQHLVGLQHRSQGDVAQRRVNSIFR